MIRKKEERLLESSCCSLYLCWFIAQVELFMDLIVLIVLFFSVVSQIYSENYHSFGIGLMVIPEEFTPARRYNSLNR